MKYLITLMALQFALTACQKEKKNDPDYLAWKPSKVSSIGGVAPLGLLDCRSLKTEKNHYYLQAYMAWPEKKDYTQSTNATGEIVTQIPNAHFYLEEVDQNDFDTNTKGRYMVNVKFQITKLSQLAYRYEVIATSETTDYFALYGTEELKTIKADDSFVVIDFDGTNYKVTKHPESIYVNESFTCQNSSQANF
jgi:hypothetical protein